MCVSVCVCVCVCDRERDRGLSDSFGSQHTVENLSHLWSNLVGLFGVSTHVILSAPALTSFPDGGQGLQNRRTAEPQNRHENSAKQNREHSRCEEQRTQLNRTENTADAKNGEASRTRAGSQIIYTLGLHTADYICSRTHRRLYML